MKPMERERDVVVIGAGISGLACAFFARQLGLSVAVLEEAPVAGGKIRSEWDEGFCYEWGPQGFLDNIPETLELVRLAGLEGRLVRASDAAAERFILRDGRLRRVPFSPKAFLTSDILTLSGKLRVLLEPFIPRGGAEEESVASFARRRIGREAAEVLVDAMVTGVYAGKAEELSIPATFPKMAEMERTYGSLTRALLELGKRARGGPAGPGGTLCTFTGGMQELPETLAHQLAGALYLNTKVATVGFTPKKRTPWQVQLASGDVVESRAFVCTAPPAKAAQLLAPLFPTSALESLRSIPSPPVVVVMMAYRSPQPFTHPLQGFGFLVPSREPRAILGTLFCHAIFPHQAPPGAVLLRTILGGARQPQVMQFRNEELVRMVRRELHAVLGGDPDPSSVRIVRHPEGIPQYTLGHLQRLAIIDEAVAAFPGLYLAGNGYRGVAVNACIAEAKRVAEQLKARLGDGFRRESQVVPT